MSAKENDLLRIQEIYDVATQTLAQLEEVGITQEQFLFPETAQDELVTEGLMNRVFRVAEEGGHLSEMFKDFGFELREMSGLRNRLAHAYGSVDKRIIWAVLQTDFPSLIEGCERFCQEQNILLAKSWKEAEASIEKEEDSDVE